MKKLVSIILAVAVALCLASCSTGEPAGTPTSEITSKETEKMVKAKKRDVIVTPVSGLRDPFVIKAGNFYYMFGTGWTVYRTAGSSLDGRWLRLGVAVEYPEDFVENQWAPEVYEYRGAYYMITTYRSSKTGRRGCAVFLSDHPDGKYTLFSDGHVTPSDWDSIDGTLYIDEDGQPWMIFVHEWVSTDDNIGRMACAKMSDDLRELISDPVELFRATDAPWHTQGVTDGCFVYRCEDGSLIMLWSNWDSDGYCVGTAKSPSGSVTGPWIQQEERLFTKSYLGDYDGGHGMIFKDRDGTLWLALHSPNNSSAGRPETPVLIPVREENGNLVWDITESERSS